MFHAKHSYFQGLEIRTKNLKYSITGKGYHTLSINFEARIARNERKSFMKTDNIAHSGNSRRRRHGKLKNYRKFEILRGGAGKVRRCVSTPQFLFYGHKIHAKAAEWCSANRKRAAQSETGAAGLTKAPIQGKIRRVHEGAVSAENARRGQHIDR
ncbi:MAG: hypothetical protein RR998_03795 [Oscillospiraceae bacterium]